MSKLRLDNKEYKIGEVYKEYLGRTLVFNQIERLAFGL